MSFTPEQIGAMLFGIEPPISPIGFDQGHDNELIFEILMSIVLQGFRMNDYNITDFSDAEKIENINSRMAYCGFHVEVENIEPDELNDVTIPCYFSKLTSLDEDLIMSRFHPFKLLELMQEPVPQMFKEIFMEREYLPSVWTKYNNMRIKFRPVNLIMVDQ